MAIRRVFLGWDRPCLHQAARWLREEFARGQSGGRQWDLGRVLVVVPASRAGRRLLEILAEQAAGLALTPPTIITAGQLPEMLYRSEGGVADPLRAILARLLALRQAPRDLLKRVVHQPPAEDDLPGWLALARDLEGLHATLAADGVRVDQVAGLCAELTDFTEQERWEALSRLQQGFEDALAKAGLMDVHAARFQALEEGRCELGKYEHLILLATMDLNRVTRRMVAAMAGDVTALIHAPESERERFDDLGGLIVEQWEGRTVELSPRQVRVVDRPSDQAMEVLRSIERLAQFEGGEENGGRDARPTRNKSGGGGDSGGPPAPDQITIGLGDETLAPMVERLLGLAGLPTRLAAGRPWSRSRPAMLLSAFAAFLASRRFDDLAALLRHPDLEEYLTRTGKITTGENWITRLDQYLSEHLQGRVGTHWLGDPESAASLKAALDGAQALVPADHARNKPLPQWSQPLADLLLGIYGDGLLDRGDAEDAALIRALTLFAEALREQSELNEADAATPQLNLAQALQLTLARLSDQAIPPEGGPPAVELLGWLELQLDDAPYLIVTGVNEGQIPQSQSEDAFLPDHVRRLLGLADNRRRYARDVAALTAILHSRPNPGAGTPSPGGDPRTVAATLSRGERGPGAHPGVTLIAGRRGAEDDPLIPSRLLLACPEEQLPARVQEFLSGGAGVSGAGVPPATPGLSPGIAPLLLQPAPDGRSRFVIPVPHPPDQPLDYLPVTAFRAYLACPYRFYLRHVLKLESLRDDAIEMDALSFGHLAHEVLQQFGASDLTASTNPGAIAAFFADRLERVSRERFGAEPPAAVIIQCYQLRQRLAALARWQAEQARLGWRIMPEHVEAKAKAVLDIDGRPFTISGRIDRIDHHPDGDYRILDYKTGDKAADPDKNHRASRGEERQWTDLQLPLYRRLAGGLGVAGKVTLGYVLLPRQVEEVGLAEAPWDGNELDSAEQEACRIIRCIRDGVFWPPTYPVTDEEFAGICMDEAIDRTAALAAGNRDAIERRRGKGARR